MVARRVRECNVYCVIYSYKTDLAQIKAMNPKGIILTGGPNSCYEDGCLLYTSKTRRAKSLSSPRGSDFASQNREGFMDRFVLHSDFKPMGDQPQARCV